MHEDPEAMKKLCLCVKSEFLEANDLLFSFGEMNSTVYILVNGWVTWPLISNARTGEKAKEISKSRILNFPNFLGLVLGCIEAEFCEYRLLLHHGEEGTLVRTKEKKAGLLVT